MPPILTVLLACGAPLPPGDDAGAALRGHPPVAAPQSTALQGDTQAPGTGPVDDESDRVPAAGPLGPERLDLAGERRVISRRAPGEPWAELVVSEKVGGVWQPDRVLVSGRANPDRPALSPDGEQVAFVSGLTGLASIWVMPFAGGEEPIQVTNVDLHLVKRAPGQPPPGFQPPPVIDDLRFDGDDLVWTGPEGTLSARWR